MSWWDYVQRTTEGARGNVIAKRMGIDQSTVSRWQRTPGRAETVAAFARAYDRPVLEAFIAAGFLTPAEANARPSAAPSLSDLDDDDLIDELRARLARRKEQTDGDEAPMSRARVSRADDLASRRRPPAARTGADELYVNEAAQHRDRTIREAEPEGEY